MKHLFLLLSVVFVTCVAGHAVITFPKATEKEAAGESYQSRKQLENGTPESVAYHVGNAGLKTLRNLMLEHTNVIISPVNIHHCLSILSVGAAGETKDEVAKLIKTVCNIYMRN